MATDGRGQVGGLEKQNDISVRTYKCYTYLSYRHFDFYYIQKSCCSGKDLGSKVGGDQPQSICWDFSGVFKVLKESSSQSELFLHAPKGLGALHQLCLLLRFQRHVNDIGQATVAQNTRDAQENLILHTMHSLSKGK